MRQRPGLWVFVVLLALGAPQPAAASSGFETTLEQVLGLDHTPRCSLCHTDETGGLGTATKPFGRCTKNAGIVIRNPGSLQDALTGPMLNCDNDLDGTLDINELMLGRNPNLWDPPITGSTGGGGEGGAAAPGDLPATSGRAVAIEPLPHPLSTGCSLGAASPPAKVGAWLVLCLLLVAGRAAQRRQRGRYT